MGIKLVSKIRSGFPYESGIFEMNELPELKKLYRFFRSMDRQNVQHAPVSSGYYWQADLSISIPNRSIADWFA